MTLATISFDWKNWKRLRAEVEDAALAEYLQEVGDKARRAFIQGSAAANRPHSAPGQYPARQTGALLASLDASVSGDTLTVSVDTAYAQFLLGTRKMAARKLVDDALEEGIRDTDELQYSKGKNAFAYFTYGGRRLR